MTHSHMHNYLVLHVSKSFGVAMFASMLARLIDGGSYWHVFWRQRIMMRSECVCHFGMCLPLYMLSS